MTARRADQGVTLITVLAVIAIAVLIVTALTVRVQSGVRNLALTQDAARAETVLRSLEQGIRSALMADAQTAPDADSLTEDWALRSAQSAVDLGGAMVEIKLLDGQSRYNLANLTGRRLEAQAFLADLVAVDVIDREVAVRVQAAMRAFAGIESFEELARRAGLSQAELAALDPIVTVLPSPTAVNMNTAAPDLVRRLWGEDETVSAFLDLRAKAGIVTPGDLARSGLILLPSTGLTSRYIEAQMTVRIGQARLSVRTMFERDKDGGATIVRRQFAPGA